MKRRRHLIRSTTSLRIRHTTRQTIFGTTVGATRELKTRDTKLRFAPTRPTAPAHTTQRATTPRTPASTKHKPSSLRPPTLTGPLTAASPHGLGPPDTPALPLHIALPAILPLPLWGAHGGRCGWRQVPQARERRAPAFTEQRRHTRRTLTRITLTTTRRN